MRIMILVLLTIGCLILGLQKSFETGQMYQQPLVVQNNP